MFSPHPQEEWPQPFPPQIFSSRRIQMMEHPQLPLLLKRELHPELHPLSHPQFVAVKSLMRNPPCFSIQFTVCKGEYFGYRKESTLVTGEKQILHTDPVRRIPIPDSDKKKKSGVWHHESDNFLQNDWSVASKKVRIVPFPS